MKLNRVINAIDTHAEGAHTRVITGGVLDVPGTTMFEKMQFLEREGDQLRRLLLLEPRGYPGSCCDIILPSSAPGASAGFVIMEPAEYPPMSGSNTIGVATALLETGMVPMVEPITNLLLETPAGLIKVSAEVRDAKVRSVTFWNVPAFAFHVDAHLDVPGLGTIGVDVAYGGALFVITEAGPLGLRLSPDEGRDIVRLGEMVKAAAREQFPVVHPENPGIKGVSLTMFSAPADRPESTLRNTVVVSTRSTGDQRHESNFGIMDRSPCGTGTSAKMAVLHAKGRLGLQETFVHEGILGTTFTGRLVADTKVGEYEAVVPTITGRAFITSLSQIVLSDDDPFPEGFTLNDIWG